MRGVCRRFPNSHPRLGEVFFHLKFGLILVKSLELAIVVVEIGRLGGVVTWMSPYLLQGPPSISLSVPPQSQIPKQQSFRFKNLGSKRLGYLTRASCHQVL